MLKILFVDDEPNILQGTRRATRDMRSEWEMYFAQSGEEALSLAEDINFDVVVTDMRMPTMDGAELLTAIRATSPSTARVILSGYAEEESVFRSTRVAHQFLSKPCDVRILKNTIAAIRTAQQTVGSEHIRDLVGRIDQLPALGDVYHRLVAAIETDRADNNELAQILNEDVALTAEILRLVNSAFFGLNRRVESVGQAIGFLGVDVLRAIVAGYSVFNSTESAVLEVDAISRRSQKVAALARRTHTLLNGASTNEAAEAYLAGTLHEVGALVLSMVEGVDPVDLRGVLGSNDVTNERLTFGVDRFAVGGYLLGLWAFPLEIVEAVSSLSRPLDERAHDSPMAWALGLARHVVIEDLVPTSPSSETCVLDDVIGELDGRLRKELTVATPGTSG